MSGGKSFECMTLNLEVDFSKIKPCLEMIDYVYLEYHKIIIKTII